MTKEQNKKQKNLFLKLYEETTDFLKNRFDPRAKYGLSLTLGFLTTLLFVYIFFGILQDLIGRESINSLDNQILRTISLYRTPQLTKIMLFFTTLSRGVVIAYGVFFLANIYIFKNKSNYLITLLASVIFGQIFFVELIKSLIQRVRPDSAIALIQENSFSFPSGHTFVAVSFYGLLVFFLYKNIDSLKLKIITLTTGTLLILMIGLSRIYLGVHFPTDVLASFTAGAAWLTALITAFNLWDKSIKEEKRPLDFNEYIGLIAFVFFVIWLAIVLHYYKVVNIPLQL